MGQAVRLLEAKYRGRLRVHFSMSDGDRMWEGGKRYGLDGVGSGMVGLDRGGQVRLRIPMSTVRAGERTAEAILRGFEERLPALFPDPPVDPAPVQVLGPSEKRERERFGGPLAFSPDGKRLATRSGESILLWSVPEGRLAATLPQPLRSEESFDFGGETLVVTSPGEAVLWDVAERRLLSAIRDGSFPTLHPSRALVSTSRGHRIGVFAFSGGRSLGEFRVRRTWSDTHVWANDAAFSPDGRWLAWAGKPLTLWDLSLLRPEAPVERPTARVDDALVTLVTFSPDGRLLAAAEPGGAIRLWSVPELLPVASLPAQKGHAPRRLRFGRGVLISRAYECTLYLWSVPEGRMSCLDAHWGTVLDADVSPDGGLLATAGADLSVRLWKLPSGEPAGRLWHPDMVYHVAFSPDGKLLASSSAGRVWLWKVPGR